MTFRDDTQKHLALRTLLAAADMDGFWADDGPKSAARVVINNDSPGRLLSTALDMHAGHIRVWADGMTVEHALAAGQLFLAIVRGPEAVDRWIFRNSSADRAEQLGKLRGARPEEWRAIMRRAHALCDGDVHGMEEALGVSERTIFRWISADEALTNLRKLKVIG